MTSSLLRKANKCLPIVLFPAFWNLLCPRIYLFYSKENFENEFRAIFTHEADTKLREENALGMHI